MLHIQRRMWLQHGRIRVELLLLLLHGHSGSGLLPSQQTLLRYELCLLLRKQGGIRGVSCGRSSSSGSGSRRRGRSLQGQLEGIAIASGSGCGARVVAGQCARAGLWWRWRRHVTSGTQTAGCACRERSVRCIARSSQHGRRSNRRRLQCMSMGSGSGSSSVCSGSGGGSGVCMRIRCMRVLCVLCVCVL